MCPYCNSPDSNVTETRKHEGVVYRARQCKRPSCGKRFISEETSTIGMKLPAAAEGYDCHDRRATVGRSTPAIKPTIDTSIFKVWG